MDAKLNFEVFIGSGPATKEIPLCALCLCGEIFCLRKY
jgi:hypothetical protein